MLLPADLYLETVINGIVSLTENVQKEIDKAVLN